MKAINLLLIFILLFSIFCQEEKEAKEFEENEITSEVQKFTYKSKYPSMIIMIIKNENYNINSYEEKFLTVYNKASQEYKEISLHEITYCLLEDVPNKLENKYFLKFKNYKGGSFIIYNSIHSYPLKNLEKDFKFKYNFGFLSNQKEINLFFNTEKLQENHLLDIYPGDSMTIRKISDDGTEEMLKIKDNSIELPKGYKYLFEFNYKDKKFNICIKKREIISYQINEEIKLNLFNLIPYFITIKPSEYNKEIIYSYLYYHKFISYEIEIAEIDSEKIDSWKDIEYLNKTFSSTENVYEIYTNNVTKNYLLIKIIISDRFNEENIDFFYTYKIFKEFSNNLEYHNITNELLIIEYSINNMIFITSNISNIRTFEKNETNSFIYQRESHFFAFKVFPVDEPYKLEKFSLGNELKGEIFFNEKSFINFLSISFDSVTNEKLWYFDTNETFTMYIKSYFGFPKIYYTDKISKEIIDDIEQKKYEKVKRYNISKDIITFDTPFALYINPYEYSFLNFIINNKNDLYILKETSNKFLYAQNRYILNAPSKLMVRLDEDFDTSVKLFKEGTNIGTLNKENPYTYINEPTKDIIFIAAKNAVINFFYNIEDIFFDESKNIISFPTDIKEQIMIVKILSYELDSFWYAINYGYDNLIPPDTKRISTTQTYFYIEDPYSKLIKRNENMTYYLILFGKNIKYEISFINKYQKEKNSFYYKITPKDNYAIDSELNFPSGYYTYELLLCENENVNVTMVDVYNTEKKITNNEIFVDKSDKKALFTFEAKSEFIFFQKENKGNFLPYPEIEFYIPKIKDGKISILLFNDNFDLNTEYSFLIFEDKNKDDDFMHKLDNECFFFSLLNNEIKDINYIIINDTINEGRFLYEEIDYTKFSATKYLLIKIYSCKNEKDLCVFSKTKRIYLENMEKGNDEEFGVKQIEEFIEYNITMEDYLFSYDYKTYLNNLEDIFLYITSPTSESNYNGELEVINPFLENFVFKFRYTETIPLIKGKHIISQGRYYFIFRNCSGVSFYLHNTIHFFPLNTINNYLSETDRRVSNGNGLIYFTMTLEEDKYIYLEWSSGWLYLYSIPNKTTMSLEHKLYNANKINKGDYILILDYGNNLNEYHFSININHYLVDLEKNKEIKVDMGLLYIFQPTVTAVVNLSKYDNELYLVSDSKYANKITCEENMDIENIIENGNYGFQDLNTHIIRIDEINQEKCDPPYYNIKLYASRFELVTNIYNISTSQNLTLKDKETIAFTIIGEGYNLVFSDKENIKWLDKMQTEFVNTIISNEQIQFKLKPDNSSETNLRIIILENKYNVSINTLTNNEIATRIRYTDDKEEIKYYINLSKNKYLINHFDYFGKLELYVSKGEMNENLIEEILNSNNISMNLFDLVTQNKFDLSNNKILAIKKPKNIFSELLIIPLIHDLTIERYNTKYLIANKKYLILSYVNILLEENTDAVIKIYDLNNTEIGFIDITNPTFENKNYNKTLYFKSNKDTLIYIYHHIKENSRNFIKEKKDDILIILRTDCEYNLLKYGFDNGFENYLPLNLDLEYLNYPQKQIKTFENEQNIIQKGTYLTAYIECDYKLVNNLSDLYKNETLNDGAYLIDKNSNIYINSSSNNKKNFFYQIFECNIFNTSENLFYASIDGMTVEKINNNTSSFLQVEHQIEIYFKAKEECLFNFYHSKYNEEDYNNLEKNESKNFNITFISRNEIKIDIIPLYKEIDFDFYFFMYLYKENEYINNSLSNKCYMQKLIIDNNDLFNDENITIIKKIEYKNGTIINNSLNVPYLKTGNIIYSNILGKGKIFEDIEEYIFYEEKSYKIEDSLFPEEKEEDNGLSIWEIVGIAAGGVALIAIGLILFFYFKNRKEGKIDLTNLESQRQSLDVDE